MGNITCERWLPVVGWLGLYEVSDWGRVMSLPRPYCAGRVLKNKLLPSGYVQVSLSVDGKVSHHTVHRLVAAAFLGPCPEGQEVLHADDDRSNNRLENLSYDTHKVNMEQMVARGRNKRLPAEACNSGHKFTAETTGYDSRGYRYCIICKAERERGRYEETKELIPVTLICPWCKREFVRPMKHGQSRRKYCTQECADEAGRAQARDASGRRYQKWLSGEGPECTTPGCNLPQMTMGKCKNCYDRAWMANYRAGR